MKKFRKWAWSPCLVENHNVLGLVVAGFALGFSLALLLSGWLNSNQ